MRNPQVKFKGGIVRVNLNSGMFQSGLGLIKWLWHMVLMARGFVCQRMHVKKPL
jgi:hypothetical protein